MCTSMILTWIPNPGTFDIWDIRVPGDFWHLRLEPSSVQLKEGWSKCAFGGGFVYENEAFRKKIPKMSLTQLTQSHRNDVMVLIFWGITSFWPPSKKFNSTKRVIWQLWSWRSFSISNLSKVWQLLNAYQASSNASEHPQNAIIYLHTGFKRIYLV